MRTIEVDDQVYDFIAKHAEAFVDTPNTVLRKLLLKNVGNSRNSVPSAQPNTRTTTRNRSHETSSEAFVKRCWENRFSGQRRQVARYRMMLESGKDVVYFQNFNKRGSPNLWYRLNPEPLQTMRSKPQQAWICFTNPAENFGYLIPLEEIDKRAETVGWDREEIEVNIDVAEDRWREFDWRLAKYHFNLENA